MNEAAITVSNLSLEVGQRYLLRDITWQVPQGENWVVFGANGCGKTTLLSILAGFRRPTAGEVKILGEAYSEENILSLRRRIGWVSSSFFDQHYTRESAQDIVLSGKFGTLGLARPIADTDIKKARALLKSFHLADKIEQPFHLMSKGERQNVLIARALMGEPEILLLDEPCTGLDILAREYFLSFLDNLAATGRCTIIYVTHHTEEILLNRFQKVLLLRNGLIFSQGPIQDIFTSERLSDFFATPVSITPKTNHGLETSTVFPLEKGGAV